MCELEETRIIISVVELASVVIAVIAAAIATSQAISAKKSLKLQKKIYEDGKPKINLDIIESFLVDQKGNKEIYFYFKIIVDNKSDKNNAVKNVSLRVKTTTISLILAENNNRVQEIEISEYMDTPINIDAQSSKKGWLVFSIEREAYEKIDINSYFLLIKDINDLEIEKEEILIKEVVVDYD